MNDDQVREELTESYYKSVQVSKEHTLAIATGTQCDFVHSDAPNHPVYYSLPALSIVSRQDLRVRP
jgi:hypothetical protein